MSEEGLDEKFENNAAYIKVEGIIQNPHNFQQVPFDFKCRIDTGFDGGVSTSIRYRSDVETIGVQPLIRNWTLADGSKTPVYICAAYLQKVGQHELPQPGKPIKLIMVGQKELHLFGMDSLQYCILTLNGKEKKFSLQF